MSRTSHVRLMASYNQWMNGKLYQAAAALPAQQLMADTGAFFGSVFGTLNHLVAGDTIWLQRFATHPAPFAALAPVRQLPPPASLSALQCADLGALAARRQLLDAVIVAWADALTEADLDHVLHYANSRGALFDRPFFSLVMHFFNHQTHHRGQASTLLSQAGSDLGVTDLLALIPHLGAP